MIITFKRLSVSSFILLAVCIFFSTHNISSAEETVPSRGKFRIQLILPEINVDSHFVDVGRTDFKGKQILVSGGGGIGGGISIGYELFPRLDIGLTSGYDRSSDGRSEPPPNYFFERSYYLLGIMYRIPLRNRLDLKLGGGGGYYRPGNLEIYAQDADYSIHYKNAFGAHFVTELEFFIKRNLALNIGGKYYSVSYREDYAKRNGVPMYFYGRGVEKLNGTGIDFMVSVATYF